MVVVVELADAFPSEGPPIVTLLSPYREDNGRAAEFTESHLPFVLLISSLFNIIVNRVFFQAQPSVESRRPG